MDRLEGKMRGRIFQMPGHVLRSAYAHMSRRNEKLNKIVKESKSVLRVGVNLMN